MLTTDQTKKLAAGQALHFIRPNTSIGIGTGSTVYYFIEELARLVHSGLTIKAVPTSRQTATMAGELGIPLLDLNDCGILDLTIDGADEIDPRLCLIKGGGGALLQEKMVAAASARLIIIADSTKIVEKPGQHALPVEVIPYGWKQTQRHIAALSCKNSVLRMEGDKPFVSDHGHYILDCNFGSINEPSTLASMLNNIPGVVENGLFVNMAHCALIGFPDGRIEQINNES